MKKLATTKEKNMILGLIKKGRVKWNGDVKLLNEKQKPDRFENPEFVNIEIGETWTRWRKKGFQGSNGGFNIRWGAKGIGFGEITFSKNRKNKLCVQSECMGKEFVKKVLAALVDSAKWEE